MANQTITKTPDAYAVFTASGTTGWRTSNVSQELSITYQTSHATDAKHPSYRLPISETPPTVSSCSIEASFIGYDNYGVTNKIICYLLKEDPTKTEFLEPIAEASYSVGTDGSAKKNKFTFSNINVETGTLYFLFVPDGQCTVSVGDPTISVTYSFPTLTVGAAPSELKTGESVKLTFTNRLSRPLTVSFSYNNNPLRSISVSSDTTTVTCPSSWFSDAGVSGSSMRVTVSVSDDLGRTTSTSITLKKPQALTPSITAPKSGTFDGGSSIAFAWTSSGDGTQTAYEIQQSVDNVSWQTLASDSSSDTGVTIVAGQFIAGTVYWRIRLKNSYNVWSSWVSASFTVKYTSPTVTLTTPTSGTFDGGQKIKFAWSITAGSGSVDGTQMQYSADDGLSWVILIDSASTVVSYTTGAARLPGGKIIWRVRASDSYSGWGTWKQASITVNYTSASVTLTAPTSGTKEGGESITFGWSIAAGSGAVNGTQMQYSVDDGLNWSDLLNSSDQTTSYKSTASQFPPGKVTWRVRAKDTLVGWGDWKQASFTVAYSAASYVVPLNSPTGGNINASIDQTFAGTLFASGTPYRPFEISAAIFYWKSRSGDPYTAVDMEVSGENASVTIPGGTFPTGTVSWYIKATDNTEETSETQVYTISTLASEIDAQPTSPVGTIETKNTETVFIWRYASISGSEQVAAELEYSIDGTTWMELGAVSGDTTTFTASADALPSGTVYWHVRAKNAVGIWGPWSSAVNFVNFGAPDIFSVLTDGKPYATIKWQVNAQESYELVIDGERIGPYFGDTVREYALKEPLMDGKHIVTVRAQNEYSQWSPSAGTIFEVRNIPKSTLQLTHRANIDAELTWSGGNDTGDFYVYRDGVPVAHTLEASFVDRVVLGTHEYFVIEKIANGYYNRSNTVIATTDIGNCPRIAPLSGGAWLDLKLSMDSKREIVIREERRVSERYFMGADYPVVEIGRFKSKQVELDAAWLRNSLKHTQFRSLLGKALILKLPSGDVFIGVLSAFAQRNQFFACGYSYSLKHMHWRDYIENN